ncbi:MAG: hypothetical protein JWR84_1719 [Caulobacter sp.]|nr:hypothetical protein [Caulobacter sp.]
MISLLPASELAWVKSYFSPPNDLHWQALEDGSASTEQIDAVAPWLSRLASPLSDTPMVLPFYRGNSITGWYATAVTDDGEQGLRSMLRAWFGSSYLTVFDNAALTNPSATPLRERFGGEVISFTGPEINQITARLALLARLEAQRPPLRRTEPRPVGRIRADLEHALAARDETHALSLIAELRATGRLNEENLQFLDIRLKAGLGKWQEIALDHWTIRNLSDLPLPPQTLSDLIEALYRVHLDGLDTAEPDAVLQAFNEHIYAPYPRLFASRHGVRSPRVVKAFILAEALQATPSTVVLGQLNALLPTSEIGWAEPFTEAGTQPADSTKDPLPEDRDAVEPVEPASSVKEPIDEAEAAYEDGQIDRAFELDLYQPLSRKSLMRLLACAQFIGTDDARTRLLAAFDSQTDTHGNLTESQIQRVELLRPKSAPQSDPDATANASGWLDWARRLAAAQGIENAVSDALDNRSTWETATLRGSAAQCGEFADLIGNLSGPAADIARQSLPLLVSAFFPDDEPPTVALKPVANVVLLLIAMDTTVSRADLETLSAVVAVLIDLGLSSPEYLTMIADLEDIQSRAASLTNLAWSLDMCELLAISPTPSEDARSARLRFFLAVVGQSQAFAHRLAAADFLPIEFLARDFGVDPRSILALRPEPQQDADAESVDLAGKLVGIYTLSQAAGARAKAVLEALFPGCRIEVNSDKVSTSSLTTLARTSDIFVFAWRSSSHQAFYCVKDALNGRDPTYAAGKGTASIINAVREAAA